MARRFKKDPPIRETRNSVPSRNFYTYSADKRAGNISSSRESPNREAPKGSRVSLKLSVERVSLIAVLLVTFLCMIYISTLSASPKIVVNSNEKSKLLHSKEEYQHALSSILNDSIMNKSKLTIDTNKVGQQLADKFPEITDVNILLPLAGRRPTAEIKTDAVKLIVISNNEAYGVGESGKVLIKVKDQPEIAKGLPRVIDNTNLNSKLGENILTSQDVAYILNVLDQLEAKKIPTESVTLPQKAAEMHIKPRGVNYVVKFSFLTDYKVAVGQYISLKKKLDADGVTPSKYIDSRVEERIYYK